MEGLYQISQDSLRLAGTRYVSPLHHTIQWNNYLNALLGTRGVSETIILLQQLKELQLPASEALYVDMGDLYFQENRLLDFDMEFVAHGGYKGELSFSQHAYFKGTGFNNIITIKMPDRELKTHFLLENPNEEKEVVSLVKRHFNGTSRRRL